MRCTCLSEAVVECNINASIRKDVVAAERSDVVGDERFDGVAEAKGDLAEGDAGSEPGCGAGVAAVVGRDRGVTYLPGGEVERSIPVGEAGATIGSGAEDEGIIGGLDQLAVVGEGGNKDGRDRDSPRTGLGIGSVVVAIVGLEDLDPPPAHSGQSEGPGPEHDDLGRAQAGVVADGRHRLVHPARGLVVSHRFDEAGHRGGIGQPLDVDRLRRPAGLALVPALRCWRPWVGRDALELDGPGDAAAGGSAVAAGGVGCERLASETEAELAIDLGQDLLVESAEGDAPASEPAFTR